VFGAGDLPFRGFFATGVCFLFCFPFAAAAAAAAAVAVALFLAGDALGEGEKVGDTIGDGGVLASGGVSGTAAILLPSFCGVGFAFDSALPFFGRAGNERKEKNSFDQELAQKEE